MIKKAMRFEVLTVVKMLMLVFWVATPCGLVGRYEHTASTFSPEDGGSMFLRNAGVYLSN
jgi:hypothetical protein